MTEIKYIRESRTIKSSHVLPPDTNCHGTLYGGRLMEHIDDVAALSAMKHSQCRVVTASIDSIDFLSPVKLDQEVCFEAFVTSTNKTSMEVFVKVMAGDLLTAERKICATSFLTFVAVDHEVRPTDVPSIVPETPEEMLLHKNSAIRADNRRIRRIDSKKLAETLQVQYSRQHNGEAVMAN